VSKLQRVAGRGQKTAVRCQKSEVREQKSVVYGEQAAPAAMARAAVTCLEAMTAKNWKQKRDEALKSLRGATDWLERSVLHEVKG